MPNKIHLTVAAVVPRNDKFLMVREHEQNRLLIGQPAGHVEPGESLLEAVTRETLEETGWRVQPRALLRISTYTAPHNGITYYRIAFICTPLSRVADAKLDSDIEEVLWFSANELLARQDEMRSPMVLDTLKDYLSGQSYPLEIIRDYR